MALASISEFEAVVAQAVIKISKVLVERGEVPRLKEARRELQMLAERTDDAAKLKASKDKLTEVGELIRIEITDDEELLNDIWDLLDYIDFNV